MHDYLNEQDTIGSIRLELNHPASLEKVWVLVEGADDTKLFRKLITRHGKNVHVEEVYLQGGSGVEKLKTAVRELRSISERIIGIRDADFMRLNGIVDNQDGVFVTDRHDVEMMIISSDDAFRAIIAERLDIQMTRFIEIRSEIIQSLNLLECIRWYNEIKSAGLNFKGLPFGVIYDGTRKKLNSAQCILQIEAASAGKSIDIDAVEVLQDKNANCYELCNGHDFICAFREFVNAHSGVGGINDKDVASTIRSVYSINDFKRTNIYNKLQHWATQNNKKIFD